MTKTNVTPTKPILATASQPSRSDIFGRLAGWATRFTGGRWGFVAALMTVIIWGVTGPYFHYSANWQLVINTGTTIVTFLMVFLIQNAQNRESKAVHLKLDELIYAVVKANNELIDVENLTEAELDEMHERYRMMAVRYREKVEQLEKCCAERGGRKKAADDNGR